MCERHVSSAQVPSLLLCVGLVARSRRKYSGVSGGVARLRAMPLQCCQNNKRLQPSQPAVGLETLGQLAPRAHKRASVAIMQYSRTTTITISLKGHAGGSCWWVVLVGRVGCGGLSEDATRHGWAYHRVESEAMPARTRERKLPDGIASPPPPSDALKRTAARELNPPFCTNRQLATPGPETQLPRQPTSGCAHSRLA